MLLSRLFSLSTLLLAGGFFPGALGKQVWVHTKEPGTHLYDCHITTECAFITIAEAGFAIDVGCFHIDRHGVKFLKNVDDGRYVLEADINPPGSFWGNSGEYEDLPMCKISLYYVELDDYGNLAPGEEVVAPGECAPLEEAGHLPSSVDMHNEYLAVAFCKFFRDPDCNEEVLGYGLGGFGGDRVTERENIPIDIGLQMKRFACF